MSIDLKILWFEDTPTWYNTIRRSLERYLKSRNFELKAKRFDTVNTKELSELLSKEHFDIIFIDLNLMGSTKGTTAINVIREHNVLSDILFYSVRRQDIDDKLSQNFIEGTYVCSRENQEFIAKAKKIIEKNILKTEDVLSIRGLLMNNVSVFDQKMKLIILKYLDSATVEEKYILNKYVEKQGRDFYKKINRAHQDSTSAEEGYFKAILEQEKAYIMDSDKIARTVNKVFKLLKSSSSDNYDKRYDNFIENYRLNILNERNLLAHAEADGMRGFKVEDKKGQIIMYDSTKCNEIRGNINKYSNLFEDTLNKWN
ncbi:Response regulator [Streptococcus pluranimalium]|uniref:hypothetical protein n=1 Tax=Streptococcus pluranimalium TaxID=82348 RepID=UPI0039E796AD